MFYKMKNSKLYEEVIKQIKDMIAQGVLKKGDKLPSENRLTEITGVSRITVREALRVLSEIGIIETRKGSGSFVIVDIESESLESKFSSSLGEYRDNLECSTQARIMLEPEVAKAAALKANENDIEKLKSAIDQAEELLEAGKETIEPFEAFHRIIFEIVNNPVLISFSERLVNLENTPIKIKLPTPDQQAANKRLMHEQHFRIYEAIKNHDGEFAYFYMKEHLIFVLTTYQRYFEYFFEKGR